MSKLRSPIIRAGGKGGAQMKKYLLSLIPHHSVYVEPFAGGASLFFAKAPAKVEVLNDIDHTLIKFFEMLRTPIKMKAFKDAIALTPYSRIEYYNALATWRQTLDEIELLRKWYIINRQSFAGGYGAGWARNKDPKRDYLASRWLRIQDELNQFAQRLRHVQLDCVPFDHCLSIWDSRDTFFYCDPPYILSLRSGLNYKYEMTDDEHQHFVNCLLRLQGKALVSGYAHEIYLPLEQAGWQRIDRSIAVTRARSSKKTTLPYRIESVWLNYDIQQTAKEAQ